MSLKIKELVLEEREQHRSKVNCGWQLKGEKQQ